MKLYNTTLEAKFISRPNRFIAYAQVGSDVCLCHVKNTGRCRELLTEGARVILSIADDPKRKTKYDLVAVYKGEELINIDSQAPNKVFGEWLHQGALGALSLIRPEYTYKNSRFDFYLEKEDRRIFAEIKGVTLEENGVVMFPDAPTERGIKHLRELTDAVKDGYEAYVFFIVQMDSCKYFTPNRVTHPQFAEALVKARESGVRIRALTCKVTPDSLCIDRELVIRL